MMAALSPDLDHTPYAILIGNMVTAIIREKPTDLQIALGVLFKDSKSPLTYMHDFGITCSYDEVLRFKKSAAVATSTISSLQKNGPLVQVVVDNFDADIHSPNGKTSTHSLAMIVAQPSTPDNTDIKKTELISRLKKVDMMQPLPHKDPDVIPYFTEKAKHA